MGVRENLLRRWKAQLATQGAKAFSGHGVVLDDEVILLEARAMARDAAAGGDYGTNDLIVSGVVRTDELQVWFLAEHLQ